MARSRRILIASGIELTIVSAIAAFLAYGEFIESLSAASRSLYIGPNGNFVERSPEISLIIIRAFGSIKVIIAFGILFIEVFSFILTGTSLFVSNVSSKRFSLRLADIGSKKVDSEGHFDRLYFNNTDVAQKAFIGFLERSREAARTAQRRPNALLFVGAIVAAVGLIFFLVTLPGFISATTSQIDSNELWKRLLDLIPRLLMLLFIQLLAGFFLRQYRSSMEEFRYYEAVLRYREAQFLSYLIRSTSSDKAAIERFAKEVLDDRNFGRISNEETTLVMEAQKHETNEFKELMASVWDFLKVNRAINPDGQPKPLIPQETEIRR